MNDTLTLYQELSDRLQQSQVPRAVGDLVLAAFHGEQVLDAVLRGEALPASPESAEADGSSPQAFLEEVRVAGFRGIGQQVTVGRLPKTGLTVFVGRNGSGKSSIAEAIEYTLTEDSLRWAQRPAAFREGWRNLHHDGVSEIRLGLRLDDGQQVTTLRTWPTGATDLTSATVTTTTGGAAMPPGQVPQWIGQAARYRPFLSARDLERVITAKPAELYDSIAPILGLGPLRDTDVRLQQRRKVYDDRVKALKAAFTELREQLGQIDDNRARDALNALSTQAGRANLTRLADLACSDTAASEKPAAEAARRLAEQDLPDLGRALVALDESEAAVRQATATDSGVADRSAQLLRAALDVHHDRGDGPCPVCRAGTLDQDWRTQAEEELARLAAAAAVARAAQQACANARRAVDGLIGDIRRLLEPAATALAPHVPTASTAVRDALASLSPDRAAWDSVVAAHTTLMKAAAGWLAQRHDAWRDSGAATRRWVDAAAVVRAEAPALALLTKARAALDIAEKAIRADRLGSFAAQSDRVWQKLRQESNVELHRLRMEGVNNTRRVLFPVAADGVETSALAVMSQGELHALGLAVFLPRACAETSPYRFVIIDDPVQSMDPTKIDGLAEVLREIALTRQVIVFTHDDRLPEAIRRLDIEADVREVTRREGSIVEVRKVCDPADRYLDDARALVAAEISDEVKYLMVAGFCRSAIESVSMDRYRAAQHQLGTPYQQILEGLSRAHTVKDRLSLGLFGRLVPRPELFTRLDRDYGTQATRTVKAVAEAVHGHRSMPVRAMVANTAALVGRLR
ncbi:AAA family ATPase [Plantactinospora sp. KLBMP9567]|uniref:AAA family ATPase n=1 Tax=Plantactinospora sp. KLBMP9567 TaxID=3085900 RepID=UPI0029821C9B|nr:AAA family ATPase [Plantactinospora sp. KLBMP9567]MDW5330649.1 AAA family ATPase [Plantactinospora sp. KLBMP9567]